MTLPFENDTGGIIRKVASAQLKHDKLKKGLSVFAIALAAFSRDLQSQESNIAVVGFGQEDMELIQSCAAVGRIPDYGTMASKNQLIVGRADDFEEYFNTKPKAGGFVTIKVFDGEHCRDMQFEIAAVLDQSKIGNNGDKIDMILLPLDAMNKIAQSNLTYQYAVRVEESYEQQAEKEIWQIIAGSTWFLCGLMQ